MSSPTFNFRCFLVFVALGLGSCVSLAPPSPLSVAPADGPDGGGQNPAPLPDADAQPPVHPGLDVAEAASPQGGDGPTAPDVEPGVDMPISSPPDTTPPVDSGAPVGLLKGESCITGPSCASGHCVDGVCCESACADACRACNRPGAPGVCSTEPAQTVCAPASCESGVARLDSRCNPGGQCVAGATSACGAYACYSIYCGSACNTVNDCVAPYTCSGNACVSPGLLLHWPFDETSGNTAQDASGNGRHGTMIGAGTSRPQPSTSTAPLTFANPRSRLFVAALDEGVVASPVPASLKATPELTVAAWFRTTSVEATGSDVVSLGGDFTLRLRSDALVWLKRKGTQAGQIYEFCERITTTHLDGRWHHLAGSSGATGMKFYFDGVEIGSTPNATAPLFSGPDQVGVGHQPGTDLHEHDGEIDDVRVYGRVLSAAEIANLAAGNR